MIISLTPSLSRARKRGNGSTAHCFALNEPPLANPFEQRFKLCQLRVTRIGKQDADQIALQRQSSHVPYTAAKAQQIASGVHGCRRQIDLERIARRQNRSTLREFNHIGTAHVKTETDDGDIAGCRVMRRAKVVNYTQRTGQRMAGI